MRTVQVKKCQSCGRNTPVRELDRHGGLCNECDRLEKGYFCF